MFDQLDARSPTPLYEQIAQRVRAAIAAGDVRPGTSLPSVRQVASTARVNPATVAQAYRLLEQEGLVVARKGAGTFVKAVSSGRRQEERRALARDLVQRFLEDGVHLGLSPEDLTGALQEALRGRDGEPAPSSQDASDPSDASELEAADASGGNHG